MGLCRSDVFLPSSRGYALRRGRDRFWRCVLAGAGGSRRRCDSQAEYGGLALEICRYGMGYGMFRAMQESTVTTGCVLQPLQCLGRDHRGGGAQGCRIECRLHRRGSQKASMLRGDLKEQVILGRERLRVDEAEGHSQHECST